MKINRLFEIVAILLNKNVVTAKELADKFQVSTRTIYRDIDVLSTAGVPIYTNKGNGGGISLLDNYVLNKTMVSEKDIENILITLQTLQATRYPDIDTVMNKLASLFKNIEIQDWIEVDISEWGSSSDSAERFNALKEAIIKSKSIIFLYYNSEGKKSKRKVDPLKLIFKGQSWYIWGYCHLKFGFRLFKLKRMKEFHVLDESFKRESYTKRSDYDYRTTRFVGRLVKLKIRFNQYVLFALYDYFDEDKVVYNNDGTIDLDFEIPESDWIYSFILSFGANAEVLEPEHVRCELKRRIDLLHNIYS